MRFAQSSGEGLDLVLAPGDAYALCGEPLRCGVAVVRPFVLVCGDTSVLLRRLPVLLVASGRLGKRATSSKGGD